MIMYGLLEWLILATLALGGTVVLLRSGVRSAADVALDLDQTPLLLEGPQAPDSEGREEQGLSWSRRFTLEDELGSVGLYERKERLAFLAKRKLYPLIGAVGAVAVKVLFLSHARLGVIPFALVGLLGGYVYGRIKLNRRKENFKRELVYFLPVVMERIVMAAQSGLDVYSAVSRVVSLEREDRSEKGITPLDPVTRLLEIVHELTEAGLSFEQALREVAGKIECSPLRHAFMHLGLAHSEGGEMIKPLSELSDATQLYYQESIEEEIAQLPVKATLPLLCTFAGLIIGFLTSPLLQILKFTSQAIPK